MIWLRMFGWLSSLRKTRRPGDSEPAGETSIEVYDRMRREDPVTQDLIEALGTGFDGMTEEQRAFWLTGYYQWQDEQSRPRPVQPAAFLMPQETPEAGLTPEQYMDRYPGQGLIVGGGVSLRYLKRILEKPEHERTDWERSILLARPEVTDVAAIDRQLRAMRLPVHDTKVIGEIPGFQAVEESEHGLEPDGSPKQIDG